MPPPEYDPHTKLITVHGPHDARFVLNALRVSYGNSPKVADPSYSFLFPLEDAGFVVGYLDQLSINDREDEARRAAARTLSDILFTMVTGSYVADEAQE